MLLGVFVCIHALPSSWVWVRSIATVDCLAAKGNVMYFVLRSAHNGKKIMLTIAPDWDLACYSGVPETGFDIPETMPADQRTRFIEETKALDKHQSMVLIFKGGEEVREFATTMGRAPAPWCEYAAALCHLAEQSGCVVSAHLWMPNIMDTDFGKRISEHVKSTAC